MEAITINHGSISVKLNKSSKVFLTTGHKFWGARINKKKTTLTYGKFIEETGDKLNSKTVKRAHDSVFEAVKYTSVLVRNKLKRGYTPFPKPSPAKKPTIKKLLKKRSR